MTTRIKNPINNLALVCLMLMPMFILGFGCNTSKPTPDPLAGWQMDFNSQPDQMIEMDYQDYIQTLTPDERKFARAGHYYKDGTGQHALVVEIALNGTWWNHVLIYDKDNKRIKTIKYSPGSYRS
jgi:hypothetical protein